MTTRKFSALKLPHPRYSLEVGKFNLGISRQEKRPGESSQKPQELSDDDANDRLQRKFHMPPFCLPRFSYFAHVIEVKEPGYTIPGRVGLHIRNFLGSHVVIQNARPELFLRRDFISNFVLKGRIFIMHMPSDSNPDYKLSISVDNVMCISMNARQYRRFGLVAKRVVSLAPEMYGSKEKSYRVEIDLKDERLLKNNKYQDKMMSKLRRLSCINEIYFRFVPYPCDKSASPAISNDLPIASANELSVEYFKYVIEEYALDGCEPVPLTGCSAVCQRIERHWLSSAQLHPRLDVAQIVRNDEDGKDWFCCGPTKQGNLNGYDKLADVMELVNWLGYQLLSLDCDLDEIKSNYPDGGKPRYDVSCTQIMGAIDYEHVQHNLHYLFGRERPEDDGCIIRALFLYGDNHHAELVSSALRSSENVNPYCNVANNSGVVYIQDCNHGSKAADEITVIGMSALAG